MRRFFLSVVLSGLVAGGVMPAQGQMDDAAAVRQTLEAFAEFVQAKDLASIDTLWATGRGVHIIEGAGVNHGWPDYRDNHLEAANSSPSTPSPIGSIVSSHRCAAPWLGRPFDTSCRLTLHAGAWSWKDGLRPFSRSRTAGGSLPICTPQADADVEARSLE